MNQHLTTLEQSRLLDEYKHLLPDPFFWHLPTNIGHKLVRFDYNEDCIPCWLAKQLIEAFPDCKIIKEFTKPTNYCVQIKIGDDELNFMNTSLLQALTDAFLWCAENNLINQPK